MNWKRQNDVSVKFRVLARGSSVDISTISLCNKSLNSLCLTVSSNKHSASACNSKIACFVKRLRVLVYIRIKMVLLAAHTKLACLSFS